MLDDLPFHQAGPPMTDSTFPIRPLICQYPRRFTW